jgi:GT2 family glycosyltransferase
VLVSPTANIAFTTASFEAAGGFDERYAYGSDIDFSLRQRRQGVKLVVINEVKMGMMWSVAV